MSVSELQIIPLSETIIRVVELRDGEIEGSALDKYGFLDYPEASDEAKAQVEALVKRDGETISFDDKLTLSACKHASSGSTVCFDADEKEDWLGFGDVTRERLFHRGHTVDCWVANVSAYIPVPFFMSTKGYAVLVNTTHRIKFDMCAGSEKEFSWTDQSNRIDFLVMLGGSFLENIRLYTQLSGKPELPPEWAFGLWYICREQANDYEAVNDAVNFRREEIPCDVIGLEPYWQKEYYDRTTEKDWNSEKFPIPSWCPNGPHNFISAIKRMGFHFELWECNEYDLSYEEERRAERQLSIAEERESDYHEFAEVDEHFEVRNFDTITKPNEPWFDHHKKFIDQGVDFFKQDGAYQVCEHPGRIYGNGMTDDEMHNLYPLLYARQMKEGLTEYTNKRPVVFTVGGWVGFQSLCGTWTGDTGGRLDTLAAMLNTAMTGHCWMTNDMEVMQPEGIHFGYLQPWSQINSWTYFRMPWVQGKTLCDMHRDYGQLRARVIPYLYSWGARAEKEGLPLMMQPLPLAFENDANTRDVLHQYLLGRDLLVSVYKQETYLPRGQWKDYWSGKVYDGEATVSIEWPENRGGNLLVREGALIPMGPLMQYRGEKPLDKMSLYVFPGSEESTFDFYEDDGVTFEYRNGQSALTALKAQKTDGKVIVEISEPVGQFTPPANRSWSCIIALDEKPKCVYINGSSCDEWHWDDERNELQLPPVATSGSIQVEL